MAWVAAYPPSIIHPVASPSWSSTPSKPSIITFSIQKKQNNNSNSYHQIKKHQILDEGASSCIRSSHTARQKSRSMEELSPLFFDSSTCHPHQRWDVMTLMMQMLALCKWPQQFFWRPLYISWETAERMGITAISPQRIKENQSSKSFWMSVEQLFTSLICLSLGSCFQHQLPFPASSSFLFSAFLGATTVKQSIQLGIVMTSVIDTAAPENKKKLSHHFAARENCTKNRLQLFYLAMNTDIIQSNIYIYIYHSFRILL